MKNACCFTGHRIIPADEFALLQMKLLKAVEMLIQYGYFVFYVGGALGFDTLAAQTVILLKEKYSFIKLIIEIISHEFEVV